MNINGGYPIKKFYFGKFIIAWINCCCMFLSLIFNLTILYAQDTIAATETSLIQFDAYVQTNGTKVVQTEIEKFANTLGDTIIGYADWLLIQVTSIKLFPTFVVDFKQRLLLYCPIRHL